MFSVPVSLLWSFKSCSCMPALKVVLRNSYRAESNTREPPDHRPQWPLLPSGVPRTTFSARTWAPQRRQGDPLGGKHWRGSWLGWLMPPVLEECLSNASHIICTQWRDVTPWGTLPLFLLPSLQKRSHVLFPNQGWPQPALSLSTLEAWSPLVSCPGSPPSSSSSSYPRHHPFSKQHSLLPTFPPIPKQGRKLVFMG